PDVRGPAANDEIEMAAAGASAGKSPVRKRRRLVGEGGALALRCVPEQRGRGERANLLVAVDHDLVADAIRQLAVLHSLQRREHDGDAALHVGNAWAVEHAVLKPPGLLEGVIGAVDGIHVTGEK